MQRQLNAFVGLPYKDRGRDYSGVDCWGLLWIVYRDALGVELPAYLDAYRPIDDREREDIAQTIVGNYSGWRQIASPEPFDAVLLRVGGIACHIGVTAGDGAMLHIMRGHSAVIESYRANKWVKRVHEYYRYKSR